jgi:pilus assembly protein CpaE
MAEQPLPVAILSDDDGLLERLRPLTCAIALERQPWHSTSVAEPVALAEALAAREFHAVCIGPDVPEPLALDIARALDRSHPEVGVVLVREASATLWREAARAGVREIVPPDDPGTGLLDALDQAARRSAELRAAQRSAQEGPRNRVIVVLSPKGGSGKTMVTTNLGVALAASQLGQTAVVDLDCVFGDVASVLGLVPERTLGQLASVPGFDSTMLKVFLTRHERSGLYVLPGSGRPEEGEAVTDEVAGRILDLLAKDFPFVVVDTAAGLDERALAAIDHATDIVLLASMDVASVRNLGKEIDALDRLGLTAARRHFILNRADARVGLEIADVEAAIGLKVEAALPSSRLVPLSMNQGRILVLDETDSPVARELLAFAGRFLPVEATARPAGRPGRFSLWRR